MFFNTLLHLCDSHNEKLSPLLKSLGLGTGNIHRWKNGTTPNGETLQILAKHFNVSTDYLLGLTDNPTPPDKSTSPEHIRTMISETHNLSEAGLKQIDEYINLVKLKEMQERNAAVKNDLAIKE